MPEECSPIPGDKMICTERTLTQPQAGRLICYEPDQIMPFLDRCGER